MIENEHQDIRKNSKKENKDTQQSNDISIKKEDNEQKEKESDNEKDNNEEDSDNKESSKVSLPSKEELIETMNQEENVEKKDEGEIKKEEKKEDDINDEKNNNKENEENKNMNNIENNLKNELKIKDDNAINDDKKSENDSENNINDSKEINNEEKNKFIKENEEKAENNEEIYGQNSEEYKDYSNEEKENEENEEKAEEEIEEEVEEEGIKKIPENTNKEKNKEKIENNSENQENKDENNTNNKKEEETPQGDIDNSINEINNEKKDNISPKNKETPSRRKRVEPHASPMFNAYGKDYITPTPKDDVEAIIEKPKEEKEEEDDNINNEKKENINNRKNSNEDNHKLIYTHIQPQIIDNTLKQSNILNHEEEDLLIKENTFNQEEIKKISENITNKENPKMEQSQKNKEDESDEEVEEIEDEEEEEDDDAYEEEKEKTPELKKIQKEESKENNNNENINNINNNKYFNKNNDDNNSIKRKLTETQNQNQRKTNYNLIEEFPIKLNKKPIYKLEPNQNINNINILNNNINNDNNQLNHKIIEYEKQNQYMYPNMPAFKNNFTYIKKNTSGNTSFRSFNKSLKNKVSMNNSYNNNNNTQQSLSNNSEKKIIGIYSKPNNFTENIEKENQIEQPKENIIEEKNNKFTNVSEKGKYIRNINKLGNEYLYKYKDKKKEEITENENAEYEDYEVSSENEANNQSGNNTSNKIIYNKKIFLNKKDNSKNINLVNNKNEYINKPKNEDIQMFENKHYYINKNNKEDRKEEEGEEESDEESYEIEESEDDEINEESQNYQTNKEIVEEKKQFKKKEKERNYMNVKNEFNTIDHSGGKKTIEVSDEENESKNKESNESSQEDAELGVEPENENEEIYILELESTGLPNLKKYEILSCNINSLINLSVPRGKEISNDVSLITNCETDFPDPFYLDELIEENNKNMENNKYKNNKNLNLNMPYENKQIKKSLQAYEILPNKINSKIYFRISCKRAGNISFTLMYKDSTQNNKIKFTKPFHILVNPIINEKNDNPLEVNQIQMQSILSHKIGNLTNNFEKYYEEASLIGYNFIHFRTLQKLTKEENIYLIKDHNELNDALFKENNRLRKNQKMQQLSNIIQNLNKKYKMGSITDVILHQASIESDWILEHNECGYNLENTPWLNVAYELDKILVNYSNLFYQKEVKCKSAPYINNINDINEIIKELNEQIINNKLEEFYYISLEKNFIHFKNYYQNILKNLKNKAFINKISVLINELKKSFKNVNNVRNVINNKKSISEIILKVCNKYGYKRYGVEINIEFVSLLIIALYHFEKKGIPTEYYFLKEIKIYIEIINNLWKEKIKEVMKISLLNIKEYLRYKYLQLNNRNKIKNLIESYFYEYKANEPSKIFLCNGWVMNSETESNLYPDFTKYGTWYLLKRKVIVIKNSIKINYGKNMESAPNYLVNYMTKYISNLAMIFEGLFIDSIHYLPMFILKYFIDIARKINPKIILICNLPEDKNEYKNKLNKMRISTNKKENKNVNQIEIYKKLYSEELGINLFVYDLIWNNDINSLMNNVIKNSSNCNNNIYNEMMSHFNTNLYSSTIIEDNQVYLGKFKYLKPKTPLNIICNITSNNIINIFNKEKLNPSSLYLSLLNLTGILDTSLGDIYEFGKNFQKIKKYKFNIEETKNLMQQIKSTKYHNEETFEVFFEFHPNIKNYNNIKYIRNVKLALNFNDWRPNVELTKIKEDLFMTKIRLPLGKYYYKYVINDDVWGYDETQPIERDNNGNINNVIDLRNHNKIISPNLKLYKQELNNIKSFFKDKNSEIYIQKNNNMVSIIRLVADYNSLINKSIEDHDILSCKNKILFYEEKKENFNDFSEKDSDKDDNDNNDKIIKKEINFKFNSKSKLSRSLDKSLKKKDKNNDNDLDSSGELKMDNNYFAKKRNMVWGSPNYKKISKFSSPFKEKEKGNRNIKLFKSNNSLLDSSMDVNLGSSSNNLGLNNNLKNVNEDINNSLELNESNNMIDNKNNEMSYYDGYAIICLPTYNNAQLGKSIITLPGKIVDLVCACFINEDNTMNIKNNYGNMRKEIYLTKNLNHLKDVISTVNYYNNKTSIQLNNIKGNFGLILKIKLGETIKNLINNLNKNLEMLFNQGFEFINYFDVNDINNLLFESDKDSKDNNKKTYEITITAYNERNIYIRKNNIKFRYAGLNQLVEIIKMIKRTENLSLLENKNEELNDNQRFMQSLYRDIYTSDGLINYILGRLDEAKSFKLMHEFFKKLILTDYKSLPNYIKPVYFEKIIVSLHHAIMAFSLKE